MIFNFSFSYILCAFLFVLFVKEIGLMEKFKDVFNVLLFVYILGLQILKAIW